MQAVFIENRKEVWICKHCDNRGKKKAFVTSGGTANMEKHLWKDHKILEQSAAEKRAADNQSSIQEAINSAESNTHKRRKLDVEHPLEKELDPAILESLFTQFISTNNQALRLVECSEFRAFLTYLNENINVWLPTSHHTIAEWVLRQRDIEKERVRLRLHGSRTKIHISLDIWTSPNTLPVLAIIAHYINEDNQLDATILGLREIQGGHNGENVALVVEEVLEEWGIISKLGCLQLDNALNNDTLARALGRSK